LKVTSELTAKLTSPTCVKRILENHNLSLRKKWGQNFLVDGNMVDKILWEVAPKPADHIIEIGPGLGVLTLPMANSGAYLLALEIDRGLTKFLHEHLSGYSTVKLQEDDVRKCDLRDLALNAWGKAPEAKIVANLPYYITSPIMFRLLDNEVPWHRAVFMVQKEVARRMVAPVDSPDYGALTVLLDCYTQAQYCFTVSRHVFYPSPRVDSAVVTLDKKEPSHPPADKFLFKKLIFAAFGQRRKTVLNALHDGLGIDKKTMEDRLQEARIDQNSRAETLSAREFANLSHVIYNDLK